MTRLQIFRAGLSLAAFAAALVPAAAFTYADQDVILVFRKPNRNDVIHNLGPIAPFLAVAPGTTIPVANWDLALTLAAYDNDLADGVQFVVMASTGLIATADRRAWITVSDPGVFPTEPTPSSWQSYWSKVAGVGQQARLQTLTNSIQTYSVPSNDRSAYTYIMSNGGAQPLLVPKLGGAAPFVVESSIPGTLRLIQNQPSSVNPKPASKEIGAFALTAAGALTFTAVGGVAPLDPPVITGVTRSGDATSVTVATVIGARYQLRANPTLAGSAAAWPVVAGPAEGTGDPVVLTANSVTEAAFYAVENLH